MLIGISALKLLEEMPSSKKVLRGPLSSVLFISGPDDLIPIPTPFPL